MHTWVELPLEWSSDTDWGNTLFWSAVNWSPVLSRNCAALQQHEHCFTALWSIVLWISYIQGVYLIHEKKRVMSGNPSSYFLLIIVTNVMFFKVACTVHCVYVVGRAYCHNLTWYAKICPHVGHIGSFFAVMFIEVIIRVIIHYFMCQTFSFL